MLPILHSHQQIFMNAAADVVPQMIDGFLLMHPKLTRLDGFPDIKVVVRKDWDPTANSDKVAVISGGGSGHEPAHAGFVGDGMLTAAVCGDIFASPSVAAIVAAIRAVATQAGVLLIVKNYTGDRLNFGQAAEQARLDGIKVAVVFVADDVAVDTGKITGRRGIAGTVFVHKIAGAAAAAGLSLEEVTAEAAAAAEHVASLGVAATVCAVPGQQRNSRIGAGEMEIGLGIHGEPGAARSALKSAHEVADIMVERVTQYLTGRVGTLDRVACLINNLGGATAFEEGIMTARMLHQLQEAGVKVSRLYCGRYMTALDMRGLSLTLLHVDDDRLARLDAPTSASGWAPGVADPTPPALVRVPVSEKLVFSQHPTLTTPEIYIRSAVLSACDALIAAEAELGALDSQVGDGDCGATMRRGAEAVKKRAWSDMPLHSLSSLFQCLAQTVREACGGTSGALYDLFFSAAAAASVKAEITDTAAWVRALAAGTEAIQVFGNAKPGMATMLDALAPAVEAAKTAVANPDATAATVIMAAATGAVAGARATIVMTAGAGRASYLDDSHVVGVADPGAMAVSRWLTAAAAAAETDIKAPEEDPDITRVIDFWFNLPANKRFAKDAVLDEDIKTKFEPLIQKASAGPISEWMSTPRGCLAQIILLDQFRRNIYRNTPAAFSSDSLAMTLTLLGVDNGFLEQLPAVQRLFLLMPFMHAENKELQHRGEALFKLHAPAVAQYAVAHREIIDRFGRFPHRNPVLGRENTPEEAEFVKTHAGF